MSNTKDLGFNSEQSAYAKKLFEEKDKNYNKYLIEGEDSYDIFHEEASKFISAEQTPYVMTETVSIINSVYSKFSPYIPFGYKINAKAVLLDFEEFLKEDVYKTKIFHKSFKEGICDYLVLVLTNFSEDSIKKKNYIANYVSIPSNIRAKYFLVNQERKHTLDWDTLNTVIRKKVNDCKNLDKYKNFFSLRFAEIKHFINLLTNNYARACRDHELYDLNIENFVALYDNILAINKDVYELELRDVENLNSEELKYEPLKICKHIAEKILYLCTTIHASEIDLSIDKVKRLEDFFN